MAERERSSNSLLNDRIPVDVCHRREERAKGARTSHKVCTGGYFECIDGPARKQPGDTSARGKQSEGFSLSSRVLRAFTFCPIVLVFEVCSAVLIAV